MSSISFYNSSEYPWIAKRNRTYFNHVEVLSITMVQADQVTGEFADV
jgi:hypothetical protein